MAVPTVDPKAVSIAGHGPRARARAVARVVLDLGFRVAGALGRFLLEVFSAAGQACCGFGMTYHQVRSAYPETYPLLPADDDAVAEYAAHGIRQLEEYLTSAT